MKDIRQKTAVGIDIGGTKISAARVVQHWAPHKYVPEDTVLDCFDREPTPSDPDAFLDVIVTLAKRVMAQCPPDSPAQAIGISTAGVVDPTKGVILGSTGNLPAINRSPYPIKAILEERLNCPVTAENDANAAAYGEMIQGAAKGYRNVLMVTLGTGVGTGLIINGQLVHGAHFSAGEGGHICIGLDKQRLCTCGRWDCWETYASGTGLAETARRMLASVPNSQVFPQAFKEATTHAVVEAFQAGNPLAKEMMDAWHYHIATGMGSLMNLLDPEVVVVGGGMSKFVDFAMLEPWVRERSLVTSSIVPASLGNQSGLVGAASLALERG